MEREEGRRARRWMRNAAVVPERRAEMLIIAKMDQNDNCGRYIISIYFSPRWKGKKQNKNKGLRLGN